MKNTFIILLLIACVACQNKSTQTSHAKEAVSVVDIKGTQILKDYFEIQEVYVVDSLLLAKNNRKSITKLFSVFDKKGKLLVRFGKAGKGPSDFEKEVLFSNQVQRNKEGDICIWLYEINYHRMRMINLSKTIYAKTVVIEKEIVIEVPFLEDPQTPFYVNSSLIVENASNLNMNMYKLCFYNPQIKKITKRVDLLPQLEKPSNDMVAIQYDYNYLFSNTLSYQPEKGFVAVMYKMDRIDFMNIKGEITKTIAKGIAAKSVAKFSDFPKKGDRIIYYVDLITDAENVYTLYNGKNPFKSLNQKDNVIKIYDWSGNLKAVFNPQEPLIKIAVDAKNNMIYGVTEDYDVYKYNVRLP